MTERGILQALVRPRRAQRGLVVCVLGACRGPGDDRPSHTDSDLVGETDTADTDRAVEPDVDTDVSWGPARLEVGTGTFGGDIDCARFEALESGQELAMVRGPQGGWHLDISLRGEGLPEYVEVRTRMIEVQTDTPLTSPDPLRHNLRLVADDDGDWQGQGCFLGLLGIFDFDKVGAEPGEEAPYERVVDRLVRIEMVVDGEDPSGVARQARASREVVVQPDPCDEDIRSPGCVCDPAAPSRPPFCDQADP